MDTVHLLQFKEGEQLALLVSGTHLERQAGIQRIKLDQRAVKVFGGLLGK